MHYQIKFPQDKFITALKGQILDVVVDLRKNLKHLVNTLKLN